MGWLRSNLLILCGLVGSVLGLGLFEVRGVIVLGEVEEGYEAVLVGGL
jgi:hypothetical protein